MRIVGIDPGKDMGITLVDVGQSIEVLWCATLHAVTELQEQLIRSSPLVAVEWWEYQGAKKSRGVPHQAAAAGEVVGALRILGFDPVLVKRGDVLGSLGMARNSNKAAVGARIRALTAGAVPRNDHEADAVAVAIAGAAVQATRALGTL